MRIPPRWMTLGGALCLAWWMPTALRAFEPTVTTVLARDVAQGYQRYGAQVAVSGSLAAVGAPGELLDPSDPAGPVVGAVYVYRRGGSGWEQVQKLSAPTLEDGGMFGATVSISGDTLVVGAPGQDYGAGAAYVSRWDGEGFGPLLPLVCDEATAQARVGDPVVVRGDWMAVGGLGDSGAALYGGAVWVFERTAEGWVSRGKVHPMQAQQYGGFGAAVDILDGRLLVGAPYHAVWSSEAGAWFYSAGEVFLFAVGEGSREDLAVFQAAEPQDQAVFGWAVSLDEGGLVVGAPFASVTSAYSGSVEVFAEGEDGWASVGVMGPQEPESYGMFGVVAKLRGRDLVVGAPGESGWDGLAWVGSAGTIHLFERAGEAWDQAWNRLVRLGGQAPTAFASFGAAIDFDGRSLLVGAPGAVPVGCGDCTDVGMAEVMEGNTPPVAVVTPATQQVQAVDDQGVVVTLSAAGSSDADGDALTYVWRLGEEVVGEAAELSLRLAVGQHALTVEVSDGVATATASGAVEVLPAPVTVNEPPVADASRTVQTVLAANGRKAMVTLDGSASTDPEGAPLAFVWLKGEQELARGAVVSVRLPVGWHELTLVVSDGVQSARTSVSVEVRTVAGALRDLISDVRGADLPMGKKVALLAVLRNAERALAQGKSKIARQQLTVFQLVLTLGRTDRAVAKPLLAQARELQGALGGR